MFLRAPPDSQPFRGDALRTWALAHGVVGYNPNGTLTDRPGAGFNPQWMNTRPYVVPGFIPLWPSMPSMPTSFLPMHCDAAPLWRSFYGMGALPGGIDVPAIIGQAVPLLEREVEAAATRAVKKVFRDYVMPPLAGVAALAAIALIVSISAYRKKNARRANRRRSNRRRNCR